MVQVHELQPLRDVKTRWDSVYMMLERLRALQPVSLTQQLDGATHTVTQWRLITIWQAIDCFFDTNLHNFSHWKLLGLDWYILEGLETVLSVSHRLNPWIGTHVMTDSPCISTKHVI